VFYALTLATAVMLLILLAAKGLDQKWVMKKPFLYALVVMVLLTAAWASVWGAVTLICVMKGGRGEGGERKGLDLEGCGGEWDGSMRGEGDDGVDEWFGGGSRRQGGGTDNDKDEGVEVENAECGRDGGESHPAMVQMDGGANLGAFPVPTDIPLTVSRRETILTADWEDVTPWQTHPVHRSEEVHRPWSSGGNETPNSTLQEERVGNDAREEDEYPESASPPAQCRNLGSDFLPSSRDKDDDDEGATAVWYLTASSDMQSEDSITDPCGSSTPSSGPSIEKASILFESPSRLLARCQPGRRNGQEKASVEWERSVSSRRSNTFYVTDCETSSVRQARLWGICFDYKEPGYVKSCVEVLDARALSMMCEAVFA